MLKCMKLGTASSKFDWFSAIQLKNLNIKIKTDILRSKFFKFYICSQVKGIHKAVPLWMPFSLEWYFQWRIIFPIIFTGMNSSENCSNKLMFNFILLYCLQLLAFYLLFFMSACTAFLRLVLITNVKLPFCSCKIAKSLFYNCLNCFKNLYFWSLCCWPRGQCVTSWPGQPCEKIL